MGSRKHLHRLDKIKKKKYVEIREMHMKMDRLGVTGSDDIG